MVPLNNWPTLRSRVLTSLGSAVLCACGADTVPVFPATSETDPIFTCVIPADQIFDGGVGRDGIPALDFPEPVSPDDAAFMHDTMRVIGVEIDGAARAYPLIILWWHEIVNDTLGGRPLLVSYCPLTGSGVGFDPVVDGTARIFGVSGLLYENNLMMFDRETVSLWNQLLMGAQCGPKRGTPLLPLPVIETTWGHWRALHPTTTVTTDQTGFDRPYGVYPYGSYDRPGNELTLVPSSPWNRTRPPKELVLGVRVGLFSAAYPFGELERLGAVAAVNDRVGPLPILVTWAEVARTARAFHRRVGGRELTFRVGDPVALTFTDTETGSTWSAGGDAIAGPLQGERLAPVVESWTVFWFSWSVYYRGTRVYRR